MVFLKFGFGLVCTVITVLVGLWHIFGKTIQTSTWFVNIFRTEQQQLTGPFAGYSKSCQCMVA